MTYNRLRGKTVWISGAASGMGEAIAHLFAVEGAKVALVDVQEEAGEAVAAAIRDQGGSALFLGCDVSQETEVQESIREAVAQFGGLDIVVNNAGIVDVGLLHETTEAEWDHLMGVNLKSIFFSVKHAISYLRRRERSYVVNIASISSFVGQSNTPAYTASKHAVLGLSRSIALDYAIDGLRCNAICPGITDTPLLRYHLNKTDDAEAALVHRLKRVPMGVALYPKDIARAALYFSCDDSTGITGTSLIVDAGYTTAAEWETNVPTRFME
jgi:NAD(P)-dependent dehydrogenase (short-subunit alcohol dehydrogenase family)